MLRLVFMFFMSLLWAGLSEEKTREASQLFNTLIEQGYKVVLVPDCEIVDRRIFNGGLFNFFLELSENVINRMLKYKDDTDAFSEEFKDLGCFFLKPDANEVLSRFLDESFVVARNYREFGSHMIFMSPENEFIIVRKTLEGEPNFVGFEKIDDYKRIVAAPLSQTNIDEAKRAGQGIYAILKERKMNQQVNDFFQNLRDKAHLEFGYFIKEFPLTKRFAADYSFLGQLIQTVLDNFMSPTYLDKEFSDLGVSFLQSNTMSDLMLSKDFRRSSNVDMSLGSLIILKNGSDCLVLCRSEEGQVCFINWKEGSKYSLEIRPVLVIPEAISSTKTLIEKLNTYL